MSLLNRLKQKAHRLVKGKIPFDSAAQYWEERYRRGYNSGAGSYGELGAYKAEVVNGFVARHEIHRLIDFGCGDGHITGRLEVPRYVGLDVSKQAIADARRTFSGDTGKEFFLFTEFSAPPARLTISLDVIFHLVGQADFEEYMRALFAASREYVLIYSSNIEQVGTPESPHFLHRKFSDWVEKNAAEFTLIEHMANPFPYSGDELRESCSDFYVYRRDGAQ